MKHNNLFQTTRAAVAACFLACFAIPQDANAIAFDLNTRITGSPIPAGWTQPYLRVTYTDIVDAGTPGNDVQIKLEALGIPGIGSSPAIPYQVTTWLFNVGPTWTQTDLNNLGFAFQAGLSTGPNLQSTSDITRSLNNITVSGDGKFDFQFEWKGNLGITNNQTVVFNVTSPLAGPAFSADTFNNNSFTDPGNPIFYSAAKVHGDSPDTYLGATAAVTVPDGGTTVLLLGAALSGLALLRKKRTA